MLQSHNILPSNAPSIILFPKQTATFISKRTTPTHTMAHFAATVIANLWVSRSVGSIVQPQGINPVEFRNLELFCRRIFAATKFSAPAIMYGLFLMHKFIQRHPDITTVLGSQYRIFIVTMMCTNKVLDDTTFTNTSWATVTGKPRHEINRMEMEFLACLQYSLKMTEDEYREWDALLGDYLRFTNASTLIDLQNAAATSLPSPPA